MLTGEAVALPSFRVGPVETPRFVSVWCWWALKSWPFSLGSMALFISFPLFFCSAISPHLSSYAKMSGSLSWPVPLTVGRARSFTRAVVGRLRQVDAISCPLHSEKT